MNTQKELAIAQPGGTPAAYTPPQLLQLAIEKGAGVDQLEKLMNLQLAWEANEASKAFVVALHEFKKNPPKLEKTKRVKFKEVDFKHATLDNACDVIGAALSQHGLSHRWEINQDEKNIKVTCVLTHVLGHSERVTMQAGADTTGSKNAIQAIASAVTYLQRYTLLSATGLAAKDQDDDGTKAGLGEPISTEQKETLIALIKETGTDTARFLAWAKAESLDELPAKKFKDAKEFLEMKKARK